LKNNKNNIHYKDGRPWNSVARFDTFHPADIRRQQLSEDSELQVKVHRSGLEGRYFTVKTRLRPEIELERRSRQKVRGRKGRKQSS
jgi:hypothetical protein